MDEKDILESEYNVSVLHKDGYVSFNWIDKNNKVVKYDGLNSDVELSDEIINLLENNNYIVSNKENEKSERININMEISNSEEITDFVNNTNISNSNILNQLKNINNVTITYKITDKNIDIEKIKDNNLDLELP